MLRKLLKLIPLALVALMLIVPVLPARAISNPASITIQQAKFFRNLFVSGDQLLVVEYDVEYATLPTEDPEDTWLVSLQNTSGNVTLFQRPLNYYNHNYISIYLTPAQAVTWGQAYYIKILGQPTYFGAYSEGVNGRTKILAAVADYDTSTTMVNSKNALGNYLLDITDHLQNDWGVTLIGLVSGRINSVGVIYALSAIPNVTTICPDFFDTSISTPTLDTTYKILVLVSDNISGVFLANEGVYGPTSNISSYFIAGTQTATEIRVAHSGDTLYTIGEVAVGLSSSANITIDDCITPLDALARARTGTGLRTAINGIGAWLGISGNMAAGLMVVIVYFLLAGYIFAATGNPTGSMLLAFPALLFCNFIGLLSTSMLFIGAMLVIGLFGVLFWMGRLA